MYWRFNGKFAWNSFVSLQETVLLFEWRISMLIYRIEIVCLQYLLNTLYIHANSNMYFKLKLISFTFLIYSLLYSSTDNYLYYVFVYWRPLHAFILMKFLNDPVDKTHTEWKEKYIILYFEIYLNFILNILLVSLFCQMLAELMNIKKNDWLLFCV